jgi:hypothetical protein
MTVSRLAVSAFKFAGQIGASVAAQPAAKTAATQLGTALTKVGVSAGQAGVNGLRAGLPKFGSAAANFGKDVAAEAVSDAVTSATDLRAFNTRPSAGGTAYQVGKAGISAYLSAGMPSVSDHPMWKSTTPSNKG